MGWTQEELAERSGVGMRTISGWETNTPKNVQMAKVELVAKALGVAPGWLLGLQDKIEPFQDPPADPIHETAPIWKIAEARHRVVPVVSYARAGEGMNFDDLAGQFDEYVTTESRDPNAFAMVVEGDSMEPEFREGDRVVIEPNSEPRNGDVVLARVFETGDVYLKKFKRTGKNGERVLLTSHNELYQDIEMERAKFRFIYPVVERKLRR